MDGTPILRCQPYVSAVSCTDRNTVCDHCFHRTELQPVGETNKDKNTPKAKLRCGGCKITYYCNKQCQRSGWAAGGHKAECKILQTVQKADGDKPLPFSTMQLVLRTILKLKNGGLREIVTLPDGRQRHFDDLVSHSRHVAKSKDRMDCYYLINDRLIKTFDLLRKDDPTMKIPPNINVFDIYCKLLINSFNVLTDDQRTVGVALYLEASVMDHSCSPNAAVVFQGPMLQVRPIQSDVTMANAVISYTELMETTQSRQEALRSRYYFDCECEYCTSPMAVEDDRYKCGCLTCPGCSDPIPSDRSKCGKCSREVTEAEYREFKDALEALSEVPEKATAADYHGKEGMLQLLHPYSRARSRAHDVLMDEAIIKGDWRAAIAHGEHVVRAMHRFLPDYDTNLALVLLKMGKLSMLYDDRLEAAEGYLTEAGRQLRILFGKEHRLYKEESLRSLAEAKMQREGHVFEAKTNGGGDKCYTSKPQIAY